MSILHVLRKMPGGTHRQSPLNPQAVAVGEHHHVGRKDVVDVVVSAVSK